MSQYSWFGLCHLTKAMLRVGTRDAEMPQTAPESRSYLSGIPGTTLSSGFDWVPVTWYVIPLFLFSALRCFIRARFGLISLQLRLWAVRLAVYSLFSVRTAALHPCRGRDARGHSKQHPCTPSPFVPLSTETFLCLQGRKRSHDSPTILLRDRGLRKCLKRRSKVRAAAQSSIYHSSTATDTACLQLH